MYADVHDKPLKDLLRDLSEDSVRLVRQETALFKTEMKANLEKVQQHTALFGAGGLIAYTGVLVLTAAVVLLLGEVMPLWVAALIIGAAYTIGGAVLLFAAKKELGDDTVAPRKTVESVKRDLRTMREATT